MGFFSLYKGMDFDRKCAVSKVYKNQFSGFIL